MFRQKLARKGLFKRHRLAVFVFLYGGYSHNELFFFCVCAAVVELVLGRCGCGDICSQERQLTLDEQMHSRVCISEMPWVLLIPSQQVHEGKKRVQLPESNTTISGTNQMQTQRPACACKTCGHYNMFQYRSHHLFICTAVRSVTTL